MSEGPDRTIYSIGHGNRSTQEFVGLLRSCSIESVIDARAYPASRHNRQFCRPALEAALAAANIEYRWEGAALGGMRNASSSSPHIALDLAVRGFADHMASADFRAGLDRLIAAALHRRVCFMCAEVQPSHCHRALISDALVVRGFAVHHLISDSVSEVHRLSSAARIEGDALLYDLGGQLALL